MVHKCVRFDFDGCYCHDMKTAFVFPLQYCYNHVTPKATYLLRYYILPNDALLIAQCPWDKYSAVLHEGCLSKVKVALFWNDFRFWPEKFSSSILQRSFCPGVEISLEIWILAHYLHWATLQKCAKIQISKEISTPGQKLRCQNGRWEFSGQNLKFFRDKVTFTKRIKHGIHGPQQKHWIVGALIALVCLLINLDSPFVQFRKLDYYTF